MGFEGYSPEQRHRALEVFAAEGGRAGRLEEALAEAGLDMRPETVRHWAYRKFPDEYKALREAHEATARGRAADAFRALADQATEVSGEALLQLAEAMANGEVEIRELPKVAKDALIAAGISTDKAELLSDRPTQRIETNIGDLARDLDSVGITVVVAGADGERRPLAIDVQAETQSETEKPELPAGPDPEAEDGC